MKKQGFTLIELMVVIVIMGILAAVAVPKLFGMIAKSKASELGTAAGSYVKLQDAFVAETAAVGTKDKIGYSMKDGDSFLYTDNFTGTNEGTTMVEKVANWADTWQATSRVKLNDCANASTWKISVKQAGSSAEGMIEYKTSISAAACKDLTPSFHKLSTDPDNASTGA